MWWRPGQRPQSRYPRPRHRAGGGPRAVLWSGEGNLAAQVRVGRKSEAAGGRRRARGVAVGGEDHVSGEGRAVLRAEDARLLLGAVPTVGRVGGRRGGGGVEERQAVGRGGRGQGILRRSSKLTSSQRKHNNGTAWYPENRACSVWGRSGRWGRVG